MVDFVRLFTAVPSSAPAAKPAAVSTAARPAAVKTADGVKVGLSPQAQAVLDQIATARGEAPQSTRPKPPGSKLNVVV
jgi:hypothetical protein